MTVKDLIKELKNLGPENYNKPVISIGIWGLLRPAYFTVPGKIESEFYHQYDGCVILEQSTLEYDDEFLKRNSNTPEPIVKDGKVICPCCGEEVVRSPETYLTRPPFYIYHCTKCIYYKEIQSDSPIQEARVNYSNTPEDYKD